MAREHRRLAAIMSADVVGYSRLMGRNETGTLAKLKAHRRDLLDPKISEHDGRIVKTTGDGLLLEFASVVDAVRCAVEVQRGMAMRNVGIPEDEQIRFRLGINVGDIIIDGDDIFGDGVNVAGRLESLADPGGICVRRAVRDQVVDKLRFPFEELGAQQVKNIARPVEIFRVALNDVVPGTTSRAGNAWRTLKRLAGPRRLAGAAIVLGSVGFAVWSLSHFGRTTSAATPPPLSLAILPFVTPAGDAAEQQLANAVARDLGSAFERNFRPARLTLSSLSIYRDKTVDARTIGRELNVRYLVEGEIRRVGDTRVIDAKLVDAGSATQLSSDRVRVEEPQLRQDGGMIARLAVRLGDALWDAEIRRARAPPTSDASATDLWLHGNAVWARDDNTLSGALEARKWFDQALRLDVDFSPALLSRVRTLEYELDLNPRAQRDRLLAEMDELTFRAVGIDPSYSRAWLWRVNALRRQWRWDAALEAIAKSEKLDPSSEFPLNDRAGIMILTGQPAAALELVEQQLARDPQTKESLGWAWLQRCRAYVALGRYDDGIAACEKQIALDDWWLSHAYLLAAYSQKMETAKTTTEKSALLKLWPGFSIADFKAQGFSDNYTFWQQTERHVFAGLRKAGIPED